MVTREQLQQLLRQRPFQPFRVHVEDGRTFDIRFHDMNLLGQTYLSIGIPEDDGPDPIADHAVPVWLNQITQVELLPAARSAVT